MPSKPSKLREQLGLELQTARTLTGLSQRDLAERTSLTQSMISRAERGAALLSVEQTQEWLEASYVSGRDLAVRILALTDAAHTETRSWPDMLGDDSHLQMLATEREQTAQHIATLSTWIPGLLQTAAYARLIIEQTDLASQFDHAAAVRSRLDRQQILYRSANSRRTFRFLIDEAALTWSPGPGVMPEQLDRLFSIATLPTVELALLPAWRTGAPSWHPFILYDPADSEELAYVTTELVHGGQVVSNPEMVVLYRRLFDQLWSDPQTAKDTGARALFAALAERHREREDQDV